MLYYQNSSLSFYFIETFVLWAGIILNGRLGSGEVYP